MSLPSNWFDPATHHQPESIGVGSSFAPSLAPVRKGDWMQTYTGRAFWPLDPRADELDIRDIAHGLSMQCRYGGHCLDFYSVAEHCVLMARFAPSGLELATLMHDATEAYLADVIRPLKRHLANYKTVEAELEQVIAQRYGLPWPMPPEVKRLDERIVADEKEQAMAPAPLPWAEWDNNSLPLGVPLQFWSPKVAEEQFLRAFRLYSRN
jgi:hypothetical protein